MLRKRLVGLSLLTRRSLTLTFHLLSKLFGLDFSLRIANTILYGKIDTKCFSVSLLFLFSGLPR